LTIEEAFGTVIRKLRKERLLSQDELSRMSSLDRVFISQLERGKQQPTLVTIFGLAAALGCSVSRMLAATELLLGFNKVRLQKNEINPSNYEKLRTRWGREFMAKESVSPCGKTILLVEDEMYLRRFLAELLASRGYDVIVAEDGHDAVNLYEENMDGIDLVLMDIMMPRKDGITAHKEIIEMNPNAKILLMSGYSEVSLGGIPDINFIQKPMVPAKLLTNIRELIDSDAEISLSMAETQPV
jgi:CheY-like chemotaxis protein/DNA-binding XRE family transcriptional regulator